MSAHDQNPTRGTFLQRVDDLERAAEGYAALGLRPVRRTPVMLLFRLPTGAHLLLFRPWGSAIDPHAAA